MNLHAEFLTCLERIRQLDAKVSTDELRGHAQQFAARNWIIKDGYQTSILVPVLNVEEEVEVSVDANRATYSYRSPAHHGRIVTRSMDDITTYALNVDEWLNSVVQIFEIESAHKSRQKELIEGHLWHIGDIRAGKSHRFAPVYMARRLEQCAADWRKCLCDAQRPSHGIVLTVGDSPLSLPNGHQSIRIDSLLIASAGAFSIDRDVMTRLLRGLPADVVDDEWFDEKTGELKLHHMNESKVFSGEKQKAVIAAFWRDRYGSSIKWSDVIARTGCGSGPDNVFGKQVWREWLESAGHGHYRIKSRRKLSTT